MAVDGEDSSEGSGLEGEENGINSTAFGGKTITYLGSVVLNTNNIVGPSLVAIPLVFQLAGVIPTTLYFLVTFVCASFSATMLCDAMQRIPGNFDFSKRYEFASTMGHFYGRKGEILGQILVIICLQAQIIASIIVAAQVMDDFMIFLFGHTYAVHFVPPYSWIDVTLVNDRVFDGEEWVLSLGYVICTVICIPFGYLNLDENMWFQILTFFGMLLTFVEFFIQFATMPVYFDSAPLWGQSPLEGQAIVLGTVVFSFAFGITVPSWVNEKKERVSVNKSIWGATILSVLMQWSFGYFAAIAFKNPKQNANILNVMTSNVTGKLGLVTKIAVYMFNVSTMIPGIPVNSILIRYNLVSSGLTGPLLANIIGVVFPWALSAFFYHGSGFSNVMNWSAILFQGVVNLVIPCIVYYSALKKYPDITPPPQFQGDPDIDSDAPSDVPPLISESESAAGEACVTTKSETIFNKQVDLSSEQDDYTLLIKEKRPVYVPFVEAVPPWIKVRQTSLAVIIAVIMGTLCAATIVMDIVFAALGIPLAG